jgi:hypothetical protein
MRNPLPYLRQLLLLTALACVGLSGWVTPWAWTRITSVSLATAIVLAVAARRSLRRASRRIDAILTEELDTEEYDTEEYDEMRLAS